MSVRWDKDIIYTFHKLKYRHLGQIEKHTAYTENCKTQKYIHNFMRENNSRAKIFLQRPNWNSPPRCSDSFVESLTWKYNNRWYSPLKTHIKLQKISPLENSWNGLIQYKIVFEIWHSSIIVALKHGLLKITVNYKESISAWLFTESWTIFTS